jgi:hypothetical protein
MPVLTAGASCPGWRAVPLAVGWVEGVWAADLAVHLACFSRPLPTLQLPRRGPWATGPHQPSRQT